MIKTVVFDIDGTLIDTELAILKSIKDTLYDLKSIDKDIAELRWTIGVPGEIILDKLGFSDKEKAGKIWSANIRKHADSIKVFAGIKSCLDELKEKGYQLGIVTSKTRQEFHNDFSPLGLDSYFETSICVDECKAPKPSPEPMYAYMEKTGAKAEEILFIGDTQYDQGCATQSGVQFGLALWGVSSLKDKKADYYFNHPREIPYILSIPLQNKKEYQWIKTAMELQFLAQGGLAYSTDKFDIERFNRIRDISAEMMSTGSGFPIEEVKNVFCNEVGFQTPKLDSRAAIFKDNKILLVKENNGTWSLPGGWVDVNQSIRRNTVKEVKEEAGLNVIATRLIALQDRNLHNPPPYSHGITKAFVLCEVIDGAFSENIETIESRYFALEDLPILAEEKNTKAQIEMCFRAYKDKDWAVLFD